MTDQNNYKHCLAQTRAGTPCRRPSGWGTRHPGQGRCKLHGGSSTGPRDQFGNTNAQVHGLRGGLVIYAMRLINELTREPRSR